MIQNIVVFGATSAIVESVLRLYAQRKVNMVLVARDADKLAPIKADLQIRGAKSIESVIADLSLVDQHEKLYQDVLERMPRPDLILIGHGILLPQKQLDGHVQGAMENFFLNANSVISLMLHGVNCLETLTQEGQKHLAVIGSVAGDVGRAKMSVYGAAKSSIERVVRGLQGRFHKKQVRVTLIKPGYVTTPMTAGMEDSVLMSSTSQIAPLIVSAIDKSKKIVYVPRWWRIIMLVVQHLPKSILFRLNI